MASLQTVVFPQDLFGYNYTGSRELYHGDASFSGFLLDDVGNNLGPLDFDNFLDTQVDLDADSIQPQLGTNLHSFQLETVAVEVEEMRPKRRRRGKSSRKNKEEIENQRMTHIAVERNRRKQMNEYLSVLRSLMPESYVPRGDQASIVGGAINFVKELEQQVHVLTATNRPADDALQLPFSECFSIPQYSSSAADVSPRPSPSEVVGEVMTPTQPNNNGVADVEVTMVESHVSMKVRSKRRPKQLVRLVSGLQAMRLTVLHLNVSTVDQVVLYSLSLKVEDECKLTNVDDIASAVYQILVKVQEEAIICTS